MKKIEIVIIIVIFILVFDFFNRLVSPKYIENYQEGNMIREYYQDNTYHDVIFIGDCEVYSNFSPLVMYQERGITSYVRGTSQQMVWQSYYILKETLKHEIPKVVVFNVNAMRYQEQTKEEYNRMTIDKMKWSQEKIDMIKTSMLEEESILSYFFPILRYHSRITKLTKEDFKYLYNDKKMVNTYNGYLMNKDIKGVSSLPVVKKLSNYGFSDKNYEYLEKIRKLCDENSIQLVLVKAPSLYPYWHSEYEKQIVDYAGEKGLKYYNLYDRKEEMGLDYNNDTYDGGLHLNVYGANKLSKYFANILSENHNLISHKNDYTINKIYNQKIEKYMEELQ